MLGEAASVNVNEKDMNLRNGGMQITGKINFYFSFIVDRIALIFKSTLHASTQSVKPLLGILAARHLIVLRNQCVSYASKTCGRKSGLLFFKFVSLLAGKQSETLKEGKLLHKTIRKFFL